MNRFLMTKTTREMRVVPSYGPQCLPIGDGILSYPQLIIGSQGLGSTGGLLRSGLRGGTGPWGQYKTLYAGFHPRAARARAKRAFIVE